MNYRSHIRFAASCALLSTAIGAAAVCRDRKPDTLANPLTTVDQNVGQWTAVQDHNVDALAAALPGASSFLSRTYSRRGSDLELFIAYYGNQRAGESIHSPKHCIPGSGWEVLQQTVVYIPVDGERLPVNLYVVYKDGQRMQVVYWYQTKTRVFASEYLGKLYLVRDGLLRGTSGGAIVRLTVPYSASSLEGAAEFASRAIPAIKRCLGS